MSLAFAEFSSGVPMVDAAASRAIGAPPQDAKKNVALVAAAEGWVATPCSAAYATAQTNEEA